MSESQLLQNAKGGDESAFAKLVKLHEGKLFDVCLRITTNHHDAEEAFTAALYLAWKNLPTFRGDSGFGTWMYRIASNTALEVVRRRKPTVSLDAPRDSESEDSPSFDIADPIAEFEQSIADNDALSTALASLPNDSREALILAEIAGLTLAEIAEHQGSSLSATKVRVHRARKSLRELLQT